MARLSFALPIFDRCERPSRASVRAVKFQPGRLAQGPDEKCGTNGRTAGIALAMSLSFQIGAPRWGGVSRRGKYGKDGCAVKRHPSHNCGFGGVCDLEFVGDAKAAGADAGPD